LDRSRPQYGGGSEIPSICFVVWVTVVAVSVVETVDADCTGVGAVELPQAAIPNTSRAAMIVFKISLHRPSLSGGSEAYVTTQLEVPPPCKSR